MDKEFCKITIGNEKQPLLAKKGQNLLKFLHGEGILLQSDCGGKGRCGKCRVLMPGLKTGSRDGREQDTGNMPNSFADLACLTTISSDLSITIPQESRIILASSSKEIPNKEIQKFFVKNKISEKPGFGLAVDLGTTTVGVYLCDLTGHKVVSSLAFRNPEAVYGADVISRISAIMTDEVSLGHLQRMIVHSIDNVAQTLCRRENIPFDQLRFMVVVGNTTMIHLFMGKDPSPIGTVPYEPDFMGDIEIHAETIGFSDKFNMKIYVPPMLSGFIGSDILSATFITKLLSQPTGTLLADLGTNGELMLKGEHGIYAASCATGPAFEGAAIHHGMIASPGAVDKVWIDNKTGNVRYSVIYGKENTRPLGICGSGIISAVAQFLKAGVILKDGAFNKNCMLPGLMTYSEGPPEFVIEEGNQPEGSRKLVILQKDIRSIQLAKSALSSGVQLLCRTAGIERPKKIFLAGAMGNHIDIQDCCTIGLFPGMKPQEHEVIGNAAGTGAVVLAMEHSFKRELKHIMDQTKVIHLSEDINFQDIFVQNLGFC
jgi:uncharacterized 2Fe-2S/4Fe-4S cluster protein (DUF4445 family)